MSEKAPTSPESVFRNSVLSSIRQTASDNVADREEAPQLESAFGPCSPARLAGRSSNLEFGDTSHAPIHSESSRIVKSTTTAASQLFSRPLIRRRSSLFESLPSNFRSRVDFKSSSSVAQKLSQSSSTLLDSGMQSNLLSEDTENKVSGAFSSDGGTNQKKPSLFGAVMCKFSSATVTLENSISRTPTKTRSTSLDSTKDKPNALMSPSGKSIMNIVNRFVMNSPFRFQSPKAKRRLMPDSLSPNKGKSSRTSPSRRHKRQKLDIGNEDSRSSLAQDENWQEAPINGNQVEVLDWSLRTKVRLECHPINFLQTVTSNQDWVDNLTYWQFSAESGSVSATSSGDPRQSVRLGKKHEKPSKVLPTSDGLLLSSEVASQLIQSVKRPLVNTVGSRMGRNADSLAVGKSQWQEALRSLFLNWCRKIKGLAVENLKEAILTCYFYAVAEDHVVLFRIESTDLAPFYRPIVLLSSCCPEFLKDLENLGVGLGKRFIERRQSDVEPMEEERPPAIMSPTVKADLEALRRAQAYGDYAGADVFIKVQKKQSEALKSQDESTPLTVRGFDDVSSFFEFYLNSLGRVTSNTTEVLPILVCDGLGPFLHASMKSLKVYPVKEKKGVESKDADAVEVEGMILPCTTRKLFGSLAVRLTSSVERARKHKDVALSARDGVRDEVTGSHFLVLHAINDANHLNLPVGANGALAFNGCGRASIESIGEPNHIYECRNGAALQLIVWDISRKNVVACKLESTWQAQPSAKIEFERLNL